MAVNSPIPVAADLKQVAGIELGFAEAGIKKPGRKDVLVMRLAEGATVSGVFTLNRFCAAPVQISKENLPIITLEEGTTLGGFGSGVLEFYANQNRHGLQIKILGVPDYFVEHGSVKEQRQEVGLTAERLVSEVKALMPRKRQHA